MLTAKEINERRNSAEAAAYHEAGHVVIGWMYCINCDSVSIVSDDGMAGYTDFYNYKESRRSSWRTRHRRAIQLMACGGPVAEAIHVGLYDDTLGGIQMEGSLLFSETDLEYLLSYDTTKPRYEGFIWFHPSVASAYTTLRRPDVWSAVTSLAEALQDRKSIDGGEASTIIKRHIPTKWRRTRAA